MSERAMPMHYLGRQIRRCQRNILIVCSVLLCALLLPFLVQGRYFANYLLGPVPLTAADLRSIQQAESLPRYFVMLHGDAIAETGISEFEQERRGGHAGTTARMPSSDFLILHLGDQQIVVKVPSGQRGNEWQGGLHTLDSGLMHDLADVLAVSGVAMAPRPSPVYLDATGFRRAGHVALAIIVPGLVSVLWVMARAAGRYRRIRTHPILKKIERYGDPGTVLLQIDAEAEAVGGHMETGLTLVTATYLIFGGEYRVEIVRFADIVWAHAQVIVQHHYTVPVGREHWLCVYEKSGQKIDIPAPGRTPRGLLKIIHDRAPDAFVGYSEELAAVWKRDPTRLAAEVQASKRQGRKESGPPS